MAMVNVKYGKSIFPMVNFSLTKDFYNYIVHSTENELNKLNKQTDKFTRLYNFSDALLKTQDNYDYTESLEMRKKFVAYIRAYEKSMINNFPIF